MYITIGKSKKNYEVKTVTNNFEYVMDYNTKDAKGISPMGILNTALVGCITMCVRTYFNLIGMNDVSIIVNSKLENKNIEVDIELDVEVSENEKDRISTFINEKCSVSKMFSKEVKINKIIKGKNE